MGQGVRVKGSSALGGRSLVLMSAMPRLCLPDFGLSLLLSPVNNMRWCWIGRKISGNKKRKDLGLPILEMVVCVVKADTGV